MPRHDLMVTAVPVGDLRTYHRNPRRGNPKAIAVSLSVNGQYRPICVNRGTHTGRPNEVLAGNHTLIAARDLEWETIDAVHVDVDDDQAARIVAADNRTADLSGYDDQLLLELLADLPDLDGTGYEPGDIAVLAALLAGPDHGTGGGSDQDILDATDKAGWPVIRIQVSPEVHAQWVLVEGTTDEDKLMTLLSAAA